MKRVLWTGVLVVTTVAVVREVRDLRETGVPAVTRRTLSAVARVTTLAQAVREEFTAGTAEREAELRADLLAGADLTRSRALVDAWRAERAARSTHGSATDGPVTADRGTDGSGATRTARRNGTGAHRPEDPDDGPVGYSFF